MISKISIPMLAILIAGLAFCNRENENFDPKVKYGQEIRTFADGREDQLPYFQGKDFQPIWSKATEVPEGAIRIPDFRFTDQHSRAFGMKELKGKVYLANFFFTRCHGICPMTMPHMRKINTKFAGNPDFRMVSYSITPDLDTPAVLTDYAKRMGITHPDWHLLTGDKQEIYGLARDSYGADTDTKTTQGDSKFLHSEQAFLVDADGYLRGIYNVRFEKDLGTVESDLSKLLASLR
ncbi:MAG: SCO family protein [Leptospiraceae bacterium]|nr:SCO family protein [Leptospiraceae bacterium]